MFIDMSVMDVMQMPIVEIVGMTLVGYCCMPALRAVGMTVASMFFAFIFHRVDLSNIVARPTQKFLLSSAVKSPASRSNCLAPIMSKAAVAYYP